MKDDVIKNFLIYLWAKYKKRYHIDIIEFIVMDNHSHLICKTRDVYELGNFMRTVNSQLARRINQHYNRDSQAIRERYKSPQIASGGYLFTCAKYIILNRHEVNGSDPSKDPYCSMSWRLNPDLAARFAGCEEDRPMFEELLDHDPGLYPGNAKKVRQAARDLLNAALGQRSSLSEDDLIFGHTIGSPAQIEKRTDEINRLRKERAPPEKQ